MIRREVDLEYVNLQALKMMKRHMLDHEITLKVAKNIATEINKKLMKLKGLNKLLRAFKKVLIFSSKQLKIWKVHQRRYAYFITTYGLVFS
ncbi:hypothetical protein EAO18_27995 [Klebsiella pneumoniae]|nr:hypothetical protein EAO18_27995 [Klebsiella pneumoniae]